jgi:hypothetical protein
VIAFEFGGAVYFLGCVLSEYIRENFFWELVDVLWVAVAREIFCWIIWDVGGVIFWELTREWIQIASEIVIIRGGVWCWLSFSRVVLRLAGAIYLEIVIFRRMVGPIIFEFSVNLVGPITRDFGGMVPWMMSRDAAWYGGALVSLFVRGRGIYDWWGDSNYHWNWHFGSYAW